MKAPAAAKHRATAPNALITEACLEHELDNAELMGPDGL